MTVEEFVRGQVEKNPSFANGMLDEEIAAAGNQLEAEKESLAAISAEAQGRVDAAQSRLDELNSLKAELNPQPLPPSEQTDQNPAQG